MPFPDVLGFVEPGTESVTIEEQTRIAEATDAASFEYLLVPETWGRDAFTRLGYIAAHVDDVTLGTGIIPVHSRSPALIAQSISTVAELDGQALLGLGLSSNYVIEQWHGIEFEPALRRQRETIEIVRQALSGEPLDYDGRLFDVEHFKLRFDPPYTDLTIGVGSQGPTNCELTGAFADSWWPNRIPLSRLDALREHVDEGARKQDRDPATVDTMPFATTCVLEDGELARRRAREEIAHYVGAMGEYTLQALEHHGYGTVANRVNDLWEAGEKEEAIEAVSGELLDEITVSGDPEQAATIIERYGSVAEGMFFLPAKGCSVDEILETIEHIDAMR